VVRHSELKRWQVKKEQHGERFGLGIETWDSKYGESIFPCNNLARKVRFAACLWFAKVYSLRNFRTGL